MKINFKSPAIYSIIALILVIVLFSVDHGIEAVLVAGILGLILCIWSLVYGIRQRNYWYLLLFIIWSIPPIFIIYFFIDIFFLGGSIHM